MNSDDLNLFERVIRAGSISRAALELGTDQSTLSRRIGKLEKELGVRLLHRDGRGVRPTERGQELLAYAKGVSDLLADAKGRLRERAEAGPETMNIGAQPTIAHVTFPSIARCIRSRFPATRLRFVEALGSQLLERLGNGDLDFAVLYIPEPSGPLDFDPLLREGVHLICPAESPAPEGPLEVARLAEIPLILPSTHHGLRRLVENLGIRHGFAPRIVLECDGSTFLTKRLVARGVGCTVLPMAAVTDEVARGELRCVPLVSPEIRRTVGLVRGRNRVIPAGVWGVTRLVKDEVAALVRSGAWPDTEALPAA